MRHLDASFVIELLDENPEAVEYVTDHPGPYATSTLALFEVLIGEVSSAGPARVNETRSAIESTIGVIDLDAEIAAGVPELQKHLQNGGEPMSPRDLLIAATAKATGATLIAADRDFDNDGLRELMDVEYRPCSHSD